MASRPYFAAFKLLLGRPVRTLGDAITRGSHEDKN